MLMVWDTSKNNPCSVTRGLWQKRRACRACVNVQIVENTQKVEVVENAQKVEVVPNAQNVVVQNAQNVEVHNAQNVVAQKAPDISNKEKNMSSKCLMEQTRCRKAINEPNA
ncbi:hypothetical protein POVCU2_0038480 [Plasmodium ovale curtisi]|uniref:Uncharacterized protein n=1 Tax=Plasmodium ovale curtisi TaxID=864141 RepID=A0A1A8W197_PLAOA|nr:hypothetical protein POVCU2_0038480 [Plasmodium ovale curtisi]SBS97060.1 hypothetical protein POVCU1_035480 [Plasmodium ovale curtisi]